MNTELLPIDNCGYAFPQIYGFEFLAIINFVCHYIRLSSHFCIKWRVKFLFQMRLYVTRYQQHNRHDIATSRTWWRGSSQHLPTVRCFESAQGQLVALFALGQLVALLAQSLYHSRIGKRTECDLRNALDMLLCKLPCLRHIRKKHNMK